MKKLMMLFAVGAAILITGCTSTKVEFEKNDKGEIKYEITRRDHWLKTDASGLQGSMTKDGDFSVAADGLASSPSEEFNKTMKTYSAAIVSMMQIAAAAYNPSSSAAAAVKGVDAATPQTTVVNVQPAAEAAKANAAATPASCPTCDDEEK